jgi:formylglycine-generating enzyme required for sulfatase activity
VSVQAHGKAKFTVRFVTPAKPTHELPNADGLESVTNSIGMTFKLIPAGEFFMGSPDDAIEAEKDERPSHPVRISKPFYLGACEVTQAQYKAVMGNNPSSFSTNGDGKDRVAGQSTDQYPVEQVSWVDAIQFCNKLSEKEGKKPFYEIDGEDIRVSDWNGQGYRLPTDAEWEYACRANATAPTRFSFGDNTVELGAYGWFDGNSDSRTHPVSQKRPNGFGLYDMHGNVWEMCWDWHGTDYYNQSPAEDPTGPARAAGRVNRGGAWNDGPRDCRSAKRGWRAPDGRVSHLGFRLTLGHPGR